MLGCLAAELPGFVRKQISREDALRTLSDRLAHREDLFLSSLRDAVYAHPGSPYLQLLKHAGCEYGDLEEEVRRDGIEHTLKRLADEGVYVEFDEFKGRSEARRGSRSFAFREEDFDNPTLSTRFVMRSGGTRSPGTSVRVSLPYCADLAANTAVALDAHGLFDAPQAIWMFSTGLMFSLRMAKTGNPPVAWFFPVGSITWKLRGAMSVLSTVTRLAGTALPAPGYFDIAEYQRMANWLAEKRDALGSICLTCYASSAVRVACSAVESGISLQNVYFITLGEPFTEAKRQSIAKSGARGLVHFGMTEAGMLGYSCPMAGDADDVHFWRDAYALIQRTTSVGGNGPEVDAFHLTSLLPSAPKTLLNVGTGDYGRVSRRQCGCALDKLGLVDHISKIRSFEKLSTEGMTFTQTDLIGLLEEVLPTQFGGRNTDYQLVEGETGTGKARLVLRIHPRVGPVDESAVALIFMEKLSEGGGFRPLGAAVWQRLESLTVEREEPAITKAGKILPFHLLSN